MSSSEVDGFVISLLKDTFKQSQSQLYFIILILRIEVDEYEFLVPGTKKKLKLNHSYRYSAEPATITEIVVLKWFTSTLSNQEPLKINSASSIPMIPLKKDFGWWIFIRTINVSVNRLYSYDVY